MIKSRARGLVTLQAVLTLILMPALFLFETLLAAELFGKMSYEQVNFLLYLLGIAGATLISFNLSTRSLLQGSETFQWVEAVRRTNTTVVILALVLFGIVFATKDKAISRVFLGSFIVSSWAFILILNRYLPGILSQFVFKRQNTLNTVLLGDAKAAVRLKDWAIEGPPSGINVVGVVTYEEESDEAHELCNVGRVADLDAIIARHQVHQVVLLGTRRSTGWIHLVVACCYRNGCRLLILNHWEDIFDQPLTPVTEGNHTFFTLQDEPLENPINRFAKRLLDIFVSLPVVLLILPLLCLIVKIAHRMQSPGPLFFEQLRTGHQQRRFNIYKFRTMTERPPPEGGAAFETTSSPPEHEEARQASQDDERIFRFGGFLRRTSLDEFPQFINVLIGNMSVVGPRPHLVAHDQEFARLVELYKTRHFVKPGITGLAQYRGFRGEITDPAMIQERIRLDLEYINHWSIWLDIGLIIRTFYQIIQPPKTAY